MKHEIVNEMALKWEERWQFVFIISFQFHLGGKKWCRFSCKFKKKKKKMDTELVVLSPSESSQSNVERGVKSLKKVANRMSATQNVLLLSDSAGKLPWFPQEGSLRLRIFLTLDDPSCSKAAKIISSFIMFLIVLSSTTFVMQSLPQYRSHGKDFEASSKVFGVVEVIAITFFTIEVKKI